MKDLSKIFSYIGKFNLPVNPVLDKILDEYNNRTDVSPCIGRELSGFIYWLVRLIKAKNAIEFGTCIGYSTIVLAEALKANKGLLTSIEIAKNHYTETLKNVEKANLTDYVKLINGDAKKQLEKLPGPFDFILQDSLKTLYPDMLDMCVEKLRIGGVLIADDTLFLPAGKIEKFAIPIDEYNQKVFKDPRLISTILPVGDGLTLSFKLPTNH